jgi:hypothetical protein
MGEDFVHVMLGDSVVLNEETMMAMNVACVVARTAQRCRGAPGDVSSASHYPPLASHLALMTPVLGVVLEQRRHCRSCCTRSDLLASWGWH